MRDRIKVSTIAHRLKSTSCSDQSRPHPSGCTLFFPFRGPDIGNHHSAQKQTTHHRGHHTMKSVFFIITICGSVLGVFLLIGAWLGADSAPQQIALVAFAAALAVIPYCVARSVQLLSDNSNRILQDIASELRKETRKTQIEPLSQPRQSARVTAPSTQGETITRPEKTTRRGVSHTSNQCPSCGKTNRPDDSYCISCRTPLDDSVLGRG